jgi:hypothetical protein
LCHHSIKGIRVAGFPSSQDVMTGKVSNWSVIKLLHPLVS